MMGEEKVEFKSFCERASVDWAYVAGFFDGEGSVIFQKRGALPTICLQFSNTNRLALDTIHRFIRCGYIYAAKPKDEKCKVAFMLQIKRRKDVKRVASELIKYCIIKRIRLAEALWIASKLPDPKWGTVHTLDRAKIHGMYINDQLSLEEIGCRLNISPKTIQRVLREEGIPLRTIKEVYELRDQRGWKCLAKDNIGLIAKLYLDDGWSARRIARRIGVSHTAVLGMMHRHDIPSRSTRESNAINMEELQKAIRASPFAGKSI
mgnify:CR=1 FL=1